MSTKGSLPKENKFEQIRFEWLAKAYKYYVFPLLNQYELLVC
jgi:hypothetical protein